MSLRRRLLNATLRLTEKRQLARVADPVELRRSFELKARMFFPPPRGTQLAQIPVGDVPALWLRAPGVAEGAGPLLLYFHGGGYVFGSPRTHRGMLGRLSGLTGLPACLPDYRMAPEHPFPAAVEDGLVAWRAVADRPGGVILGGDSAGGGLALALMAEGLRQGLRAPRGVFALSPLTDLTFGGESMTRNARVDALLPASRAQDVAEMYLDGADPRDPRASPLFADLADAPPVWLTAGDTEILLDDTTRMVAALRRAGGSVTCRIVHDLPHVWPYFPPWMLPESAATLADLAAWIRPLAGPRGDS